MVAADGRLPGTDALDVQAAQRLLTPTENARCRP